MIRSGIIASIVGLIVSRLFDGLDSRFGNVTDRIKFDFRKVALGVSFILLGVISFSIFLLFGAIFLFMILAGMDVYSDAAMITTIIIFLISVIFFYSGIQRIKR